MGERDTGMYAAVVQSIPVPERRQHLGWGLREMIFSRRNVFTSSIFQWEMELADWFTHLMFIYSRWLYF